MTVMSLPQVCDQAQQILAQVERAVVGKRHAAELVLSGILAGGHVLMEDYPGLGKTLAARSFAQALGLGFSRAQFTPDLLPSRPHRLLPLRPAQPRVHLPPRARSSPACCWPTRSTARPPRPSRRCSRRCRRGRSRSRARPSPCRGPSTCSPRPTPSSTRAPTRCPRPSSTGSCCASASATPPPQEEWEVLQRRMDRRQEAQDGGPGHRRRGTAGDAAGHRDRHRRRRGRPVLRRARRRDPHATSTC